MFINAFKGFVNSFKGKTLWRIVCLSLVWFVWQERNARIFENKKRPEEEVWDIFYFYSSLWADCTKAFSRVPLSVLLLNWATVCISWFCLWFCNFLYFSREISSFSWYFLLFLIYVSVSDKKKYTIFDFFCLGYFTVI